MKLSCRCRVTQHLFASLRFPNLVLRSTKKKKLRAHKSASLRIVANHSHLLLRKKKALLQIASFALMLVRPKNPPPARAPTGLVDFNFLSNSAWYSLSLWSNPVSYSRIKGYDPRGEDMPLAKGHTGRTLTDYELHPKQHFTAASTSRVISPSRLR